MCRFISGLQFCSIVFFLHMDIFQMVSITVVYRIPWNLIMWFLQLFIFNMVFLTPNNLYFYLVWECSCWCLKIAWNLSQDSIKCDANEVWGLTSIYYGGGLLWALQGVQRIHALLFTSTVTPKMSPCTTRQALGSKFAGFLHCSQLLHISRSTQR